LGFGAEKRKISKSSRSFSDETVIISQILSETEKETMKKILSLTALIILFTSAALADIRLETPTPKAAKTPKKAKSIDSDLRIRISSDEKEARLIIPKSQLKQLRAELENLDEEESGSTAALNFSKTKTIASGLFLSLALVFGGVWLARTRKLDLKANKTLVVGAGLFFIGALATVTFANIGPPFEARSITGKIFSPAVHQYKQAWGTIKVETSDSSDGIELIVPDAPKDDRSEE
jgi:hypothetical protein